jgi:hypothetical protein
MKAEDFAAWLSATSRMNEVQRGEAIAALEKASAVAAEAKAEARRLAGIAAGRTRWERPAMSASRRMGVPIAPGARSSVGAVRMGFCGSAAGAAGAPSMR